MERAEGAETPAYRAISWIFTVEVRSLAHVMFVEEKVSVV
jgi:hypothetical protein